MTAPSRDVSLRFGLAQTGDYDLLANVGQLAHWGFDYAEASVVQAMALSDAEFAAASERLSRVPELRVEAMNAFFPADLKLLGASADPARIEAYVRKAFSRACALGVKVIGFGSGAARSIPDGLPPDQARIELRRLLRRLGEMIERERLGFVIALEGLSKAETNFLNSTVDTHKLVVETNHPKIRLLCDLYHLTVEGDTPQILKEVKDRLVHTHIANPCADRAFPGDPLECPAYRPFFEALHAIGYQGRLSVEANSTNWDLDAPTALATLRKLRAGSSV